MTRNKNVGKEYEKRLFKEIIAIKSVWSYNFAMYGWNTFKAEPGDYLILHPAYNMLIELKSTQESYIRKDLIRPKQLEALIKFEQNLHRNYAFVALGYRKYNSIMLIPLSQFITAPSIIDICIASIIGFRVDNIKNFILKDYKQQVKC